MRQMLFILMMLVLAVPAFAQNNRRGEFFVGYSNLQAEGIPDRDTTTGGGTTFFGSDFFNRREGLHGINVGGAGYFAGALGIAGDFSFHRQKDSSDFAGGVDSIETRVIYFTGGPQVKFRNSSRVEPFVRVLAGGAHTRFEVSSRSTVGTGSVTTSFDTGATDFALVAGGGVDIRLSDRFSLRAIQFDYTPVFLRDRSIGILGQTGAITPFTLEGQRQDNVRFSVGLVF